MNLQVLKDLATVASKFVPTAQKQAVADMLYELAESAAERVERAERELGAVREQLTAIQSDIRNMRRAEQIEDLAAVVDPITPPVDEVKSILNQDTAPVDKEATNG